MTFFYENFTRADVKARLYLINFKFPAKHAGCHFSLISDVTPSIPIYLFNCIKTIVSFWNSVMDRNSNEMGLVAYNFEPEYSEEEMT
jgi:hypothetical protein